jgi:hypothetical protein
MALPAVGPLHAQNPAVAIEGITVITATGVPPLSNATVLIRDGRIAAIGPAATVRVPSDAEVIDGRGKFLIPGLIDTHVHLAWAVGRPDLETQFGLGLGYGITGYREASGIGREADLVALRQQIDSGVVLAPRLFVSGSATPQNVVRYGAEGLADLVARLVVIGVDGIKFRNLSRSQVDTVIAAARLARVPAFGHTYGGTGAPGGDFTLQAIEAGATGVMHVAGIGPAAQLAARDLVATGWQRDWLNLYLRWKDATAAEEDRLLQSMIEAGVWLEPTFTTEAFALYDEWYRGRPESRLMHASYDSTRMGFPAFTESELALARAGFGRMQRFVLRFRQAGGLVPAGTDGVPWPGAALHEELRLLTMAGLSPLEALQAATRDAARVLGWAETTGTIAVDMDADLVLLEADPLQDISNTLKISAVFRAGQQIVRTELDSLIARADRSRLVGNQR